MRRRRRTLTTQLARAGERTRLVIADEPIPELKFRASTLADTLEGTVEVEADAGRRTQPLGPENTIDAHGLRELSIVPAQDTAITFQPPKRPISSPLVLLGILMMFVALAWTAWDLLGLAPLLAP